MIYPQNFEQKIEFNSIRQMLKENCLCTLGRERVDTMEFMTEFDSINQRLCEVVEFIDILKIEQTFPHDFYYDVREPLARIRIQGMFMSEDELFNLRRSLDTIGRIISILRKSEKNGEEEENSPYPNLRKLAGETESFPRLLKAIDAIIDKFGYVKDSASRTLSDIRSELSRTSGTISRTLQSILRRAQAEGLVEKDVSPTMRDGRLVIPVAPALKRKMRGIIHDESASGKTVFIEPAEVVEANNRIRELEAAERREIIKILTAFADEIRPEIPQLMIAYEFLGEVDFVRAKAQLSIRFKALKPSLVDKPIIDWGTAIHPLLQLSLEKHGKKMSALDIELTPDKRILLISGPNAGGKSICLKTAGLLQYMLQCGMLIPLHERSNAGIFHSIFIDIGDEQSIENDLSTYSGHLLNMKHTLRHCDEQSLILIDEFGNGTEPLIGGAIAEAMLKRFNNSNSFGIITTHYQNLKHLADSTPGIANGAMLYDRAEMRPLFQLQTGNPGSSFAVEIARKIGLPEDLISDASEIVGSDYIQSDKFLQDIVRDKRYWESKRKNIHKREKELEETIANYEKQFEEVQKNRKTIIKEAQSEAKEMLRQANAKIENTIRSIIEAKAEKERTREIRAELSAFSRDVEELVKQQIETQNNRDMEKIIARQERRDKGKENKKRGDEQPRAIQKETTKRIFEVGSFVRIKGQQSQGEILSINKKNAQIAFGAIKSNVELSRLEHCDAPKKETRKVSFLGSDTREELHNKRLDFKSEIDIRGFRGEEAIQAITYFIDDATLFGTGRVRILHGTGNGILRTLVRQYLLTVPAVASFHDEHVQFGGAGITIVEFH